MANDNIARGLIPIDFNGSKTLVKHTYRVSTAADIYLGQPVQMDATGYVVGIGTPTANTRTIGVAIGFTGPLASGLAVNQPYLKVADCTPPANGLEIGDRYVVVADDPAQEYLVQEDTGSTALTLADAFAGFGLIYMGAVETAVNGNANTGWATLALDRSSILTSGTSSFVQTLRVLEIKNQDGTDNAPGNYCKWVVRLLNHTKGIYLATQPIV